MCIYIYILYTWFCHFIIIVLILRVNDLLWLIDRTLLQSFKLPLNTQEYG